MKSDKHTSLLKRKRLTLAFKKNNILSLFHPFFKSNKLYKRTSISVFVEKKDKTNNLTMNSHFTVTVTGSSGLVWPISQKWSILNNTSFSSIKSSLIVFLMKKKRLVKVQRSLSHHVWYICLSVSFRFTEDAAYPVLGLVPVVPRAPGREWALWGRAVSGEMDAVWTESGTYCCTWQQRLRPLSCCPRCLINSGGRNTGMGTFSVRPNNFQLQPAVLIRQPSASSISSCNEIKIQ